jgi:hypothetical protein
MAKQTTNQTKKQPKKVEPAVEVRDLEPRQDVKGGGGFDDITASADSGSTARKFTLFNPDGKPVRSG